MNQLASRPVAADLSHKQANRLLHQPRALRQESERVLRDVAYVLKLTQRLRQEILAEQTDRSSGN